VVHARNGVHAVTRPGRSIFSRPVGDSGRAATQRWG
jgi:hypothetical protein